MITKKAAASLTRAKCTRVFIADGDAVVRDHFTRLTEIFPAFTIAGRSESAEEALRALSLTAVDLLVIDIDLNRKTSGADLIATLREKQSESKILVTGKGDRHQKASFSSGAHGFLLKPFNLAELTAAVATVLDGRLFYKAGLLEEAPALPEGTRSHGLKLPESLTDEDRTYIHARLSGKSDAQIAEDLKLKIETISQRRHKITRRLGLDTDIESFLLRATQWHIGPRRRSAAGGSCG